MAAIRMTGTLWTIWLVSPCPMKPAPIKPTRIGFPCSSLALNALSTMIMVGSRAHPALHLALDFLEVLPGGVLGRDDGDRQWPLQAQARIERREPSLGAGRVELAHLVARLRRVLERLVPVREALGDIERAVVVGAQIHRDGLQEGRTLGPQVHDDVEDRPARGADQLRLGVRRVLEVHPAQGALPLVVGDVRLRDHRLEVVLGELLLTKSACEEAAVVVAPLQIEDECALQLGLGDDHDFSRSSAERLTPRSVRKASANRAPGFPSPSAA